MDFLLECVGFPPDFDHLQLLELVAERGEPTPWRDRAGRDRRLALGGGLELRLDHALGPDVPPQLLPWFNAPYRMRVAVDGIVPLPDSPFDALLHGRANPPLPGPDGRHPRAVEGDGSFPFACHLGDRRRLGGTPLPGHVLAISAAGFALDVSRVYPDLGGDEPGRSAPPRIHTLGGADAPAGCLEIDAPMRTVAHLANPLTGLEFDVVEVEAPGRPLTLFVSRWQLAEDAAAAPRAGWRIAGVFLFQGRLAGGVPRARVGRAFG